MYNVDFLRALGLILLIGVHVHAPEWYVSLRSFDVPLMVFVSAMCYKPIRGGVTIYIVKRFKRIYIPVFVFLVIYFTIALLSHNLNIMDSDDIKVILGSFMLLNEPSIGFVWVMRVFLIEAIILPIMHKITSYTKYSWAYSILVLILVQSLLVNVLLLYNNKTGWLLGNQLLLYAIGYGSIIILGLVIKKLSFSQISNCVLLGLTSLLIFMCCNKLEFCPQIYKYPPQLPYSLYGIIVCSLLWMCRPSSGLSTLAVKTIPVISYLSKNSMWIYLWHILALHLLWSINRIIPMPFLGRYCVVIVCALIMTSIYLKVISFLPNRLYDILK